MKTTLKCKSTAIAAFLAAATASVALPACEQGAMYCLAASGTYGARFTSTGGQKECIGKEVQKMYIQYYLGVTDEVVPRPDPTTPSVAVTMASARKARDAADSQVEAINQYKKCKSAPDYVPPAIDTAYQQAPFYSLAPFTSGDPDANDQCFATAFAAADLTTPNIPAVPKCEGVEDSKARPAYTGEKITYTVSDMVVKVKPSIQGQLVRGKINYSKDGCSGSYDFVALNPAVPCETNEECTEKVLNGAPNPKAVKVNGELRAEVSCGIAPGDTEGYCVYNGSM